MGMCLSSSWNSGKRIRGDGTLLGSQGGQERRCGGRHVVRERMSENTAAEKQAGETNGQEESCAAHGVGVKRTG